MLQNVTRCYASGFSRHISFFPAGPVRPWCLGDTHVEAWSAGHRRKRFWACGSRLVGARPRRNDYAKLGGQLVHGSPLTNWSAGFHCNELYQREQACQHNSRTILIYLFLGGH